MAYFRIEYYSNALRRETSFEMLIPNDPRAETPLPADDRPMKTLLMLRRAGAFAGKR